MARKRALSHSAYDCVEDSSRKRQARHDCRTAPPSPQPSASPSPHFSVALTASLTEENLSQLQQSFGMPAASSRGRSRSPEKMDPRDRMQLYNIFYEDGAEIPGELVMLIADLRQEQQAPSPNAKLIQKRIPLARSRAEQDGFDLVNEVLLWNPATLGGTPCVERASKCALSSFFAPPPTSTVADGKPLETAQPDHCYGYLPSKKARPAKLDAPFSRRDENIMNTFSLTDEMYFPFFTAQWKSPAKSQTHHQAIPQGARDGATINNHLHLFYSIARPDRPPSLLETCHFSATIDMRSVILWVHWRDVDEDGNACYRMEEIESGMLNKERDNKEIRTILRNLQEHAMGARLQDIKALLPQFWARYEHSAMRKGALKARNTSDAVSVVSSSSVVSSTSFVMQMPTPPPIPGEPVRKRRRETSESQPSPLHFSR